MSEAILPLPPCHTGYALARAVLRDPDADREQIEAACAVLQCSDDWGDIRRVREARNRLWSALPDEPQAAGGYPVSGRIAAALVLAWSVVVSVMAVL